MPRGTATEVSSALRQVQGKARQVLKSLAHEIRANELELRRLRDDEVKLAALAGQRSAPARAGRSVAHLEKGPVESIGERFWRDSLGSSRHPKSAPCAGSRTSGPRESSRRLLAGWKQAR
jgi:hypothetical protein